MTHERPSAGIETKYAGAAIGPVEADGSFAGYASLFGAVDLAKDVVEHGAFARSLAQRGPSGVRMLFQHDPAQPIGVWTDIREDERGLFVRGKLTGAVSRSAEVLSLMRAGALDGLSIGFRPVRTRRDAVAGVRRILEADLWEISVVTFPMLPGARVATVKGGLPTTRIFERWLTRDAGLTRSQARTVIARGYSALIGRRDGAASPGALADTIRAATRTIQQTGNRV